MFVGGVEEKLVANKAITQVVDVMGPYDDKMTKLRAILNGKPRGTRIIIFCSTKRMCDQLARNLGRDYGAAAIHGDKKQQERDYVIGAFKNGSNPIMVATDVAARGLDVSRTPLHGRLCTSPCAGFRVLLPIEDMCSDGLPRACLALKEPSRTLTGCARHMFFQSHFQAARERLYSVCAGACQDQ